MLKKINLVFLLLACFLSNFHSFACGNYYYFADRPLPLTNGFLDYHQLFVSPFTARQDSGHREILSKSSPNNPYFYSFVNLMNTKITDEHYREPEFDKLLDTLKHLLGNPKNSITWSYKELANKALMANVDFKLLSDFAWKLAQRKEYKTAEKILIALEKQHPSEYNVLANLGTVYELLGNPKLAMLYLAKAIQISPDSHYGSEWIHINILKRKLGFSQNYADLFDLDRVSIAYDDYKIYEKKIAPNKFGKYHRDTMMLHLAYQLHERMFFIGEKDPIMGDLFYMFLQCMIHRGDYAYAAEAANLCLNYNTDNYFRHTVIKALGYCLKEQKQ